MRSKWGFDGSVVSDCDAIKDAYQTHKYSKTPQAASAQGIIGGCDQDCGETYGLCVRLGRPQTPLRLDLCSRRFGLSRRRSGERGWVAADCPSRPAHGPPPRYTAKALQQGLIQEATVDTALARILLMRFRLGEFDPADMVPYRKIPPTVIENNVSRLPSAALALGGGMGDWQIERAVSLATHLAGTC